MIVGLSQVAESIQRPKSARGIARFARGLALTSTAIRRSSRSSRFSRTCQARPPRIGMPFSLIFGNREISPILSA
ncbi:MAG: hypothetical protein DYH02_17345 [Candidatus Omnitrophica bacterium COP1]|nr:hypothetical protein [Candidatus Omnitrophica bacterium COP1]